MSANIPIRGDAKANEEAMNKVKEDKLREVTAGHDGTWVSIFSPLPLSLPLRQTINVLFSFSSTFPPFPLL